MVEQTPAQQLVVKQMKELNEWKEAFDRASDRIFELT